MKQYNKFTADFETTTDEFDCRVWAWGLCDINDFTNFKYGNTINSFMNELMTSKINYVLYFHNLKFDSQFIFHWLLINGYKCVKDKKERKDKTFTCLISNLGAFYSIEIYFQVNGKHINKVTIYDSLKILNMSVKDIAKGFNLPILKGEIDYKAFREYGHELTIDELAYLRNDVEIMARALRIMFDEKLTKMTIASDALNSYKELETNFDNLFPVLSYETDDQLRDSYKGGFTYLNPKYKEQTVGSGLVLDVNSLYPSVMYNDYLPYDNPIFFSGKYKEDKLYPLYIQRISCAFKIKKGKIPTIQIKNNLRFLPNEYLESSNGEIIVLTLTNIDLELFLDHYNVYFLKYDSGFKFKQMKGLFKDYIDYWSDRKIQAKKDDNKAIYKISKLMLNSLYGKFGLNPNVGGKFPILENGEICYKFYETEIRDSIYVPIASFITSYARRKTITTSQAIRDYTINKYGIDYYIYSDTDSIHMLDMDSKELSSFVEVDDYLLGAWKIESRFTKGKYLRQKCYIEEFDGELNVTVAGLPKTLKLPEGEVPSSKVVNFDNFEIGFTTNGKLNYKKVNGGVILVDTEFTIK